MPEKTTTLQQIQRQLVQRWRQHIVILIILHFALGLTYLKTVPRFYNDEAVESSYGYSLAYTETLRSELFEGFGGMHIHYVQPRIILPLVCASIYKVAGFSITTGRYLVAITPSSCALIFRLVSRIIASNRWYTFQSVVSASIVVIYLPMSIAAISLLFYRLHGVDFDKVLDHIASVISRKDRVYGEKLLWMGHDRYHYEPFPADYSVTPWRQTIETVRKHRFDCAVRSFWLFTGSCGVALPPAVIPDFRPSYTIDQVCKRFGTKIDEFRDPYFGPFEI